MDWQPIETAPKDGTEILVAGGTADHPQSMAGSYPFVSVTIARWDTHWKFWEGAQVAHGENMAHDPTHWMPLPPPPVPVGTGREG